MTRDDVIDVLSVVAAATRRTVGKADVKIWQEIIGTDDRKLAMRAVRDHLAECPGVWLEPGHVHQRVRALVRDELEREPDSAREARQAALEAKVRHDVEALAERKGIPGPLRVKRPAVNPLTVRCSWCHAGVGQHCVIPRTNQRPAGGAHPCRVEAAKQREGAQL